MSDPMNRRLEVPIDEAGLIAEFDLEQSPARNELVSLMLEADAEASYEVYVGVSDRSDEQGLTDGVYYFGDPPGGRPEAKYVGVTDIADAWYQAEPHIGVWVKTPAPANETATLAVSRGQ